MCWVCKTISTQYQKSAKSPEVFQTCRRPTFYFYSAIFVLDGHFPLTPTPRGIWSSRWTDWMYMILMDSLKKKKEAAWFFILCLTSPTIDEYLCVLPRCLTKCIADPILNVCQYQHWESDMWQNMKMATGSPPHQLSFLPQFPISVDHKWMINHYSTAERRTNTGGKASPRRPQLHRLPAVWLQVSCFRALRHGFVLGKWK